MFICFRIPHGYVHRSGYVTMRTFLVVAGGSMACIIGLCLLVVCVTKSLCRTYLENRRLTREVERLQTLASAQARGLAVQAGAGQANAPGAGQCQREGNLGPALNVSSFC